MIVPSGLMSVYCIFSSGLVKILHIFKSRSMLIFFDLHKNMEVYREKFNETDIFHASIFIQCKTHWELGNVTLTSEIGLLVCS